MLQIGNDVVDLEHPRCRGRSTDDRLLRRILTRDEREWLDISDTEASWTIRLWALWAAKEAGFKVLAKLPGGPRALRYRSFACRLRVRTSPDEARTKLDGSVQGPGSSALLRLDGESDSRHLHVVAWNGADSDLGSRGLHVGLEEVDEDDGGADLESFRERFSAEEWVGIHSLASARVRLRARERLAAHLGPGVEILTSGQRPGRTPPRIRVNGRLRTDIDVSLSHHGRYVAWAILLPPSATGDSDAESATTS